MTTTVAEIIAKMEQIAPQTLAETWDNVGLMVGEIDAPVQKVLLALDLSAAVVEQACTQHADLIITHHPVFFKPLQTLAADTSQKALAYQLIRNNIAVYSAHTNWDIASGGVNDVLVKLLGLKTAVILQTKKQQQYYKIATFVPEAETRSVLAAMTRAGAGNWGGYSECAYQTKGIGQFRPLEGSTPFVGTLNVLEKTVENKIEVLVAAELVEPVIKALVTAHPYEVPAYEIIAIANKMTEQGLGRVGLLAEATDVLSFAQYVKRVLAADYVNYADAHKPVAKVAVCGGSGGDLVQAALAAGADTLVTG
ncbi:MAG: Nif3-like dinuclear metal center hexameric protein, partial [Acidaminococcaceae bacterium]